MCFCCCCFFRLIQSRIFHSYGDITITNEVCKCSPINDTHGHGEVSVPHLLWHGAFVYNGHLRGPVTLIPTDERLAVELSLLVLMTGVCRGWDSNTQPSACGGHKSVMDWHIKALYLCDIFSMYVLIIIDRFLYCLESVINFEFTVWVKIQNLQYDNYNMISS